MILQIDTQSHDAIYEQLRSQIILGIASGQLQPGEHMPSVRRLAADLGINLHTVNKVYTMLCDEHYLVMDRRKGAVVSHKQNSDGDFERKLKRTLTFAAAEAHCRNIDEKAFLQFCEECFGNAGNSKSNKGDNT
ncbi:MAG: GntR family transcriptional regulator [Oscillospiraceae bacterium]|nr:GntR family transcriptional regulator [Oscillospiraceae bacterium]